MQTFVNLPDTLPLRPPSTLLMWKSSSIKCSLHLFRLFPLFLRSHHIMDLYQVDFNRGATFSSFSPSGYSCRSLAFNLHGGREVHWSCFKAHKLLTQGRHEMPHWTNSRPNKCKQFKAETIWQLWLIWEIFCCARKIFSFNEVVPGIH